jgi:deoxyribonuclease-4
MRRLGAHMSIAGGYWRAVEEAKALGCRSLQIFLKNARSWGKRPLKEEEEKAFFESLKSSTIEINVAHSSYLINLASSDEELYEKSLLALTEELFIAQKLHIPYYVLHLKSGGNGKEEDLFRVARALNMVLWDLENVMILLETSPSPRAIGSKIEDFARLFELLEKEEKVGLCLDSCHLWAAGYDLSSPKGFESLLRELEDLVGLKRVRVIHLNDAKDHCGSGRDRHEHIGRGQMGLLPFKLFLQEESFQEVPFIIETPKGKTPEGRDFDEINLAILRKLEEEDADKDFGGEYLP